MGFGLRLPQEWRELTESVVREDGSQWIFSRSGHRRLFEGHLAASNAVSEAKLWQLYDATQARTLLLRGPNRICSRAQRRSR